MRLVVPLSSLLLLSLLNGAPGSAAPPRATCKVTDGAVPSSTVVFELPRPAGFAIKDGGEACVLFASKHERAPQRAPLHILLMALHNKDGGQEQLLNREPDGARLWLKKLVGAKARELGAGKLTVAGRAWPYYRVLGKPPGMPGPREVLITRVKQGRHNLVLVAHYRHGKGEAALMKQGLAILGGVRARVAAAKAR